MSELTIEGNRLAPRVLIPCMPELLVGNDDSKSENVEIEFKIVPIFINIGINEKQSLTDAMAKENKKSIIGIGSKKNHIELLWQAGIHRPNWSEIF